MTLVTSEARPGTDAGLTPTIDDVRRGLRATLPEEEADRVWARVCTRTGVDPSTSSLSEEGLDAVLTAVSEQDRLCRVLATSWRIRRTAARRLAALGR